MICQKTLDKRIAKVMNLTEELEILIKREDDPDRILILVGNYRLLVQHILLGYSYKEIEL